MKRSTMVGLLGVLVAVGIVAGPAGAQTAAAPTFSKDVAPILFENCVKCHRPGQIAPMSLLSYRDARPWARAIKEKVVAREMPPWFADPRYGTFRNAQTLTDAEIRTIAAWVDAGAPAGSEAEMPAVPTFVDDWTHPSGSAPDHILAMPVEAVIQSEGEFTGESSFLVKVPFETDVFAEALEVRPSNMEVVHHAAVWHRELGAGAEVVDGQVVTEGAGEGGRVEQPEVQEVLSTLRSGKVVSYVPGRGFEQHRKGAAKRIIADENMYLAFQMHYQPTGKVERDQSELGIWLSKEPVTHEIHIATPSESYVVGGQPLQGGRLPVIPAFAGNWEVMGSIPVNQDITLYAFSPHMHLRGKDMMWVVVWPDGREEILVNVPNYDFNWQQNYELETPIRIPAGSKLINIGHFDNSVGNRYNPAPQKEVYWAEQSWDEMFNGFIEFSIDSHDLTKDKPPTE